MEFDKDDQIEEKSGRILHRSAGGFVFFEDPGDHKLFVALLKTEKMECVVPKGHLKKWENSERAAVREVVEELSLPIIPKVIGHVGTACYKFSMASDGLLHEKTVELYVFELEEKVIVSAIDGEGFVEAFWMEFNDALNTVTYDKENLLRARQIFYFQRHAMMRGSEGRSSMTIGIPTHNGSITIVETIRSIYRNIAALNGSIPCEIIICMDHCTDSTKNVLKNFKMENTDLTVAFKIIDNDGPKGKSSVLNKIFEISQGNIFCVVDDDVILEKDCLNNLSGKLRNNAGIAIAFARWKRLPLKTKNPWRVFWHWMLGLKFDIQPYKKPSAIMRGACMMFFRNNYVRLPDGIFNEDQFLQYIYWPNTLEVKDAILYFNSVSGIMDYYHRFVRITMGVKQLESEFSLDRIKECADALGNKIDYSKVFQLPPSSAITFICYQGLHFIVSKLVKIQLLIKSEYDWFRFKQG